MSHRIHGSCRPLELELKRVVPCRQEVGELIVSSLSCEQMRGVPRIRLSQHASSEGLPVGQYTVV